MSRSRRASNDALAGQLVVFMRGDHATRNESAPILFKHFVRLARSLAPDQVALDRAEDIGQQALVTLLTKRTSFSPVRGHTGTFLGYVAKEGARAVRASYVPPGERTRLQKRPDGSFLPQALPRSFDSPLPDGKTFGEIYPDRYDRLTEIEENLFADEILEFADRTASPTAAAALQLIAREALTVDQAARRLGVDRFALRRELRSWGRRHRALLVA